MKIYEAKTTASNNNNSILSMSVRLGLNKFSSGTYSRTAVTVYMFLKSSDPVPEDSKIFPFTDRCERSQCAVFGDKFDVWFDTPPNTPPNTCYSGTLAMLKLIRSLMSIKVCYPNC